MEIKTAFKNESYFQDPFSRLFTPKKCTAAKNHKLSLHTQAEEL